MKKFLGVVLASTFLSSAAFAQGVNLNSQVQPGTPNAPGISSPADGAHGAYFGTNRVGITGHLETGLPVSGDVPTLSVCGGTVAGDAGSTDTAGTATQGGTVTTCTITFGTAFTSKPACIVSDLTGTRAGMGSVATTTAITITGITAGDAIAWICAAKSGG